MFMLCRQQLDSEFFIPEVGFKVEDDIDDDEDTRSKPGEPIEGEFFPECTSNDLSSSSSSLSPDTLSNNEASVRVEDDDERPEEVDELVLLEEDSKKTSSAVVVVSIVDSDGRKSAPRSCRREGTD